jgi:hypothetical protein
VNGFLEDSERFWGDESAKPAKAPESALPRLKDGKYILYRWTCPICHKHDKGCSVRKGTKEGIPVLYCEVEAIWVNCIYVYL